MRDDVLAAIGQVASVGCMGPHPRNAVGQTERRRRDRLGAGRGRFFECSRLFWGDQTGPSPTDRRKRGSKHHIITDANGIPLAASVTAANRNDITQLIPLVDAIAPVRGKPGRPRKRPACIVADRGYDSNPHREQLRQRRMRSLIARRNTEHGSGLGTLRWHVERTLGWLHKHRRLAVRYEKRADIHDAFLTLGCICVCYRFIENFC